MTAPTINFSGLASGIDTNALISATSDAARQTREKPAQDKVTELDAENQALNDIKGKLSTLKTILQDFTTASGGPLRKIGQSSDETVATTTAANSANNGTYQVTVTQLAQNATQSFGRTPSAYTSATAKIASTINMGDPESPDRTVNIQVGTGSGKDSIDIPISDTTTLADFVTAFNNKSKLALATIVNVGSTGSPDYRIIVTSNNTGTVDGTIVTTVGASVTADGAFNVPASLSQAQDAVFSVAGIGGTITRSSNSVSDLIPGVTLNLKGAGGPASLTIGDDITGTTTVVQKFIDAYNDLIEYFNENNTVTRQDSGGSDVTNIYGTLAKTSLDDNVVATLRSKIAETVFKNGSSVRIFADLGIRTDPRQYSSDSKTGGGTLLFKTDEFSTAMSTESASVAMVLESFADAVAATSGVIDQYAAYNQVIDQTVSANTRQITDLNNRIAEAEKQILQNEDDMRSRFAKLESTMSRLQSQQQQLSSSLSALG